MPTPSFLLQLSAGAGPVEVRRFVADLAPAIEALLARRGLRVLDRSTAGPPEAPQSVTLGLAGPGERRLDDLLGTHVLVDPCRGRGARRRWFARVSLHPVPAGGALALDPADLEVRACRAGGPGGQRVNTRATAVQVLHRPTGVRVRADGERSQAANRRAALARLAGLLAEGQAAARARGRRRRRDAHHALERGNPVMAWRRGGGGELEAVALRR